MKNKYYRTNVFFWMPDNEVFFSKRVFVNNNGKGYEMEYNNMDDKVHIKRFDNNKKKQKNNTNKSPSPPLIMDSFFLPYAQHLKTIKKKDKRKQKNKKKNRNNWTKFLFG